MIFIININFTCASESSKKNCKNKTLLDKGNKLQVDLLEETTFISLENFGMHIHNVNDGKIDFPEIKFGYWRLWDCGVVWGNLEREKGKWDFEKLDKTVEIAKNNNVKLIMTLGHSPKWATKKPKDRSPYGELFSPSTPLMEEWKNYLKILTERYNGKIFYWEIWNEPDLRYFYTGTVKELVELSKVAYKIIKEANPQNIVISPCTAGWFGGLLYLNEYLKLGGGDFFDILSFHYYTYRWLTPETFDFHIKSIKKLQKKYKIENKKLWVTEIGNEHSKMNRNESVTHMIKNYTYSFLNGIDKVFWYSYDGDVFGTIFDKKKGEYTILYETYNKLQNFFINKKIVCSYNKGSYKIIELIDQNNKLSYIKWKINNNREIPIFEE